MDDSMFSHLGLDPDIIAAELEAKRVKEK